MSEGQAKKVWQTQFNHQQAPGIDLSRRINHTCDFAFDDHGKVIVVDTGDVDIHAFIQAQSAGTDLKDMLAYISRTGDMSPLNASPGIYADITGMPETIGEAMQQAQAASAAAHELNGKLPEELKVLGSDIEAVMASPEFQKKMADFIQAKIDEQKQTNEGDSK